MNRNDLSAILGDDLPAEDLWVIAERLRSALEIIDHAAGRALRLSTGEESKLIIYGDAIETAAKIVDQLWGQTNDA